MLSLIFEICYVSSQSFTVIMFGSNEFSPRIEIVKWWLMLSKSVYVFILRYSAVCPEVTEPLGTEKSSVCGLRCFTTPGSAMNVTFSPRRTAASCLAMIMRAAAVVMSYSRQSRLSTLSLGSLVSLFNFKLNFSSINVRCSWDLRPRSRAVASYTFKCLISSSICLAFGSNVSIIFSTWLPLVYLKMS